MIGSNVRIVLRGQCSHHLYCRLPTLVDVKYQVRRAYNTPRAPVTVEALISRLDPHVSADA